MNSHFIIDYLTLLRFKISVSMMNGFKYHTHFYLDPLSPKSNYFVSGAIKLQIVLPLMTYVRKLSEMTHVRNCNLF